MNQAIADMTGLSIQDTQILMRYVLLFLMGYAALHCLVSILNRSSHLIKGAGDAIVGWVIELGNSIRRWFRPKDCMAKLTIFTWFNGLVHCKVYHGDEKAMAELLNRLSAAMTAKTPDKTNIEESHQEE